MKNFVLIVISLFCFNQFVAQNQAIKITNTTTNKVKVIKENKRIKLKTFDGETIKGRFTITDNNTITINGLQFNLADIEALKRNPLFTTLFTSGFFIYLGSVTIGLSILIGVLVDSSAFWLTIPAAGMVYAGIKSPNFNKNHKVDKGWKFEIITVTD